MKYRAPIPCLVCGVPCYQSSRCAAHRLPDRRPGNARRLGSSKASRLRQRVLYRDRWTCQACGVVDRSGKSLEADHIVRLADDGTHDLENLQTLCRACHSVKTAAENSGS